MVGSAASPLDAFVRARAQTDPVALAAAALDLVAEREFGVDPGRIPAMLHEAYRQAPDQLWRARLAAGLARAWVYGGEPDRAGPFADEALDVAERLGDPVVLADALDSVLLTRWGPDQFDDRRALSTRIEEAVAHVEDVNARLSAHLWRLTLELESLNAVGVLRLLRTLDGLASETDQPRARFFAESRRAMFALVQGDFERVTAALPGIDSAGSAAAIVDSQAVLHSLSGQLALQRGDAAAMAAEAVLYEEFGLAQGVQSVTAQAVLLWAASGDLDRAESLLLQVVGEGLHNVHRDVDWLLTTTSLMRAAIRISAKSLLRSGIELLVPYADRAVVNAGAVTFHGVVADVLFRTALALGERTTAQGWCDHAAQCYRRLGARWWLDALDAPTPSPPPPWAARIVHLRPTGNGFWVVGADGTCEVLPDAKGLHYLRELIARPGVEVSALEMVATVAGRAPAAFVDANAGEVLDPQARAAYRQRLSDIDEDLAEASAWADEERSTRLRLERDALLQQLSAAVGLGGRIRISGSDAERARVAVRKAIVAAFDRIDRLDPTLARLLREGIRTGRECRYDPDPARPVEWRLGKS